MPKKKIVIEAETAVASGSRAVLAAPVSQPQEIIEVAGKPRVLAGVCEFCGVPAESCPHYGNA